MASQCWVDRAELAKLRANLSGWLWWRGEARKGNSELSIVNCELGEGQGGQEGQEGQGI